MNIRSIRYILSLVLKLEGLLMLLPCIVALVYKEKSGFFIGITLVLCLLCGTALSLSKPKNLTLYAKEGFIAVSLSWIVLSFFGALPFFLSGEIPSLVDAIFEAVSGFTTTGASILEDVESMSRCLLFWRSFTHWIGGMGVLVFLLALLPMNGGQRMYLMRAESPGPSVDKLVPKVKGTALILYEIYTVMTIIEIILLLFGGMPLFDALCISFGTAGTGGFGVLASSCGDYAIHNQVIITIFMIAFGVNFSIYYLVLTKKFRQVWKSEELRAYLGIIALAIIGISVNIHTRFATFLEAVQQSAFQVGSIITTTGYATTDFDLWPEFSKVILIMLMFIGASAGSTGGGLKVSRILIMLKTVKKEVFSFSHPHGVKKIKMDGHMIPHDTVRSVNIFLIAYLILAVFSILLISLDNADFTSNFTAVAATLNNIGPGLAMVGPTCNFGFYSDFSKLVMIFDMLAGRLEIFPLLALLSPTTWQHS